MLRKMSPSNTEKTGDDVTAAVPPTERTRLLELNTFQLHADRETCDQT